MMRTTPDERAEVYTNPKLRLSAEDIAAGLTALPTLPSAPFEILGESIVPGMTNVPAVLQGTFVQVTNIGTAEASIFLQYRPTATFKYGPTLQKVVLGANYIDGNLKIFDYTDDFKRSGLLFLKIAANKTIIAGLQYYIDPNAKPTAPTPPKDEDMGNRGVVAIVPSKGSRFLVTATVRQNFIRSLTTPTDIISSAAYDVPLSSGPVVDGTANAADLFEA